MQNLHDIQLNVTEDGGIFTAQAHTYPYKGKGLSFKEAIGDWVYVNCRSGTNIVVGGPVFAEFPPKTEVACAAQQQ